ncbi:hypothetical protein [Pleomorphovibrio marinus]|uniref:hypothetical protein n=1 Tax=Pleomorphovibrio marinus TaxID=2164132 RepID=UPI000E0A0C22|nr:hypothetical protein [Pleomorphovibrio marinus]
MKRLKNKLTKSLLLIIAVVVMGLGCGEEEAPLTCKTTCDNEEIVETFKNVEARVIKHNNFGFILTINPADFDKESFVASNDFILVPCNWNFSYNHNSRVVINGVKKSCCSLLIPPFERGGYGCKFEITSIEALKDK